MRVYRMAFFYLFLLINTLLYKHAYGYLDINNLTHNNAFDLQLFEDVLDPVLCQEQLHYLRTNNTLLLATFMDAGIRVPKGILMGNVLDMGNYYQCLRIEERIPGSVIEGKYCSINVPLDFLSSLPLSVDSSEFLWRDAVPNKLTMNKDMLHRLQMFEQLKEGFDIKHKDVSRFTSDNPLQDLNLNLALCLPKVCTTREAVNGLLNTTAIDFSIEDNFCRLPNDKPRVPADCVAIIIFSLIGILTILSTCYDVYFSVLREKDPRKLNNMCLAFSVYTNTRRLVTYDPVPGTLECLDGIRVISMIWVIVGHTFAFQMNELLANPLETLEWTMSLQSLWITAAPISVDTFFTLSGLLVVYTTAGKLTGMKFLKNLHMFYLNRLLRMFPILAAFVLAQASFINRVADGPNWNMVAAHTHRCRVYWWSTLLYIQNFFNPENMCIAHTWYLAVDMQLYFLSPIVLYWILSGRKRYSWTALIVALSCAMLSSSIYNIIMEFPSGPVIPTRLDEHDNYMMRYYIHTMTRSPPFFIGMIYGYMLHLYRNKKCVLAKLHVTVLWICAIGIMGTVIYSRYPIVQMDWDNQTADTLINSLKRPSWALALGWVIFACVCGYGGPINWLLSLRMWKVPSRISYAMYIVHYPLMYAVISSTISPIYFSVPFSIMKSLYDVALAMIVAFLAVVLIDAPCTVLIKQFMGPGPRKPQKKPLPNDLANTQPTVGSVNNAYITDELKFESK